MKTEKTLDPVFNVILSVYSSYLGYRYDCKSSVGIFFIIYIYFSKFKFLNSLLVSLIDL